MLRIDVIRKLAKTAGIPEVNLKDFAEVFLWKLTEVLIENDVFFLKDLGYFKLQTLKKNFPSAPESGFRAILFSEKNDFKRDVLVFGVPESRYRKKEEIDSYLNLGIGKPIIPTNQLQFGEKALFYLPEDLDTLYYFKAEEILNKGEFLRDNKVIEISRKTAKLHPQDGPNNGELDQVTITDNDLWKDGEDWGKDLDESELLHSDERESSFWDTNPSAFEEAEEIEPAGELTEPDEDSITFEDLVEEEFSQKKGGGSVSSETKELKIDLSELSEEEPTPDFGATYGEQPAEDSQNFDLIFKKSLAQNVLSATLITPPESEVKESEPEEFDLHTPGIFPEEEKGTESNTTEGGAFNINAQVQELPRRKKGKKLLTAPFRGADKKGVNVTQPVKKSSRIGYLLFALLCVVLASFVYYKNYGIPPFIKIYLNDKQKEIIYEIKVVPTVIERDYDIPVSYPYPGEGSEKQGSTESKLPVNSVPETVPVAPPKREELKTQSEIQNSRPERQENLSTIKKPSNEGASVSEQKSSYLVKGNIFKEGEFFVIQLFATRSRAEADAEVSRLKSKGITAYVMEAQIPNRGTWYRVRIGTFNSLEEAQDFARTIK